MCPSWALSWALSLGHFEYGTLKMIRILADENVHSDIQGLLKAGYEVLCVPQIGLAGSSDEKLISYPIFSNSFLKNPIVRSS